MALKNDSQRLSGRLSTHPTHPNPPPSVAMGVPYYFYVITQQHPGILRKYPPANTHRFFLDYNGGVHPVCHRLFATLAASVENKAPLPAVSFETRLCDESWAYLLTLVREVSPGEVHIALDGVAPVAKIQQQRKRRYVSILRQKMLNTFSPWDTNAISPGTQFMAQLNQTFRDNIARLFSPIPFHFYGSDEPGEGEHKIFECLTAARDATPRPTIIYGLDADLIMLSILSHCPHIFLMREEQQVKNKPPSAEPFVYLDIDALRVGILKTLFKDYHWPIPETLHETPFSPEACDLLENYIVACFLLGNDFLPNITCLHLKQNGLAAILHAFKDTWDALGHPLIEAGRPPSMVFLAHWFGVLAKDEDTRLAKLNDDYAKKRAFVRCEEDKVEFYPILPEHKSPLAAAIQRATLPAQWRSLYYKYLLDAERQDRSRIVHACREYITGILWTYHYYTRRPKPYDWYYPFGYAPTLLDLTNQLSGELNAFESLGASWAHLVPDSIPPLLQLLAILPIESHGLLPPAIRARLHHPSSPVRYMYPIAYPICTYMKQHLWECHPKLPMLDFKALSAFKE